MERPITSGRLTAILACLLCLPLLVLAKGDFNIEQEDGLFTVSADDAALSSVISRLSEITEIPMNIAEGQDTQVTLSLSDYTLESLIEELSSSSMIIRKSVDGTDVISEVVFMLGSEGSGVAAAALPSGEPNEGIIAGDTAGEEVTEAYEEQELEVEPEPQTAIQVPGQVPGQVSDQVPGQDPEQDPVPGQVPGEINPETGELVPPVE